MSLWDKFVDYTIKSNNRAHNRHVQHDSSVSDGRCCHCKNFHYDGLNGGRDYRCYKKDISFTEEEGKKYGCKDFDPVDIDWWKI